jgi:Family of unknown function (DUF6404)
MKMTHQQKVDHLIADLGTRGVGPYTVAPPFFRLLWALGLNVPPPFFLGFFSLTVFMGVFFGVLWGALMWLSQWRARHSLMTAVTLSAVTGLSFGLSMAWYYRRKARRLGLPSWNQYPGAGQAAVDS